MRVVYDNDQTLDVYTDEILMALASVKRIQLTGMITTRTVNGIGYDKYDELVAQRKQMVNLARESGMRLSTVYGIVRQSGGHVWCDSKPGKGTTFRVYLPRTDALPTHEAEQDAAPTKIGRDEHILVVEDEDQVRAMLGRILRKLHYRVTIAENGEEALHLIEEKGLRPDLIITDVVMPGMGGILLIERVRKTLPGQKVLCMSGYIDDDITHQDVLDHNIPFIQKPFSLRDISAKIKQVMPGKEQPGEEGK